MLEMTRISYLVSDNARKKKLRKAFSEGEHCLLIELKTLPKAGGYFCVGDGGHKKTYSTSEQQMAT